MNLDYNILWIDDRPRQVENAVEHIKVRLARKGFHLNVKMIDRVADERALRRQFNGNDYDLLVVDYKMQPGACDGSDLIRLIRRFCDSTDIVFYSSEAPETLRKKINVDGVYCANRNDLHHKLDHVIHSTIKKVLDLNNMRGISLSQIADFDHLLDESIALGYAKLLSRGVTVTVVEDICSEAISFHKKAHEEIESMARDLEISEYISLLSSNPKYGTLIRVIELLKNDALDLCSKRISQYEAEIIQPRNKLAHAMEKKIEAGAYFLENNSKEIKFSQEDFTGLRLKLLEYRDQLHQIKTTIDSL